MRCEENGAAWFEVVSGGCPTRFPLYPLPSRSRSRVAVRAPGADGALGNVKARRHLGCYTAGRRYRLNDFGNHAAMATGAGDEYWKEQALPSVFKHTLLDKYMPQFAGMTGSVARGRRVVYLDGYAGRGR